MERLRKYLQDEKMTQQQFAGRLGLRQQTVAAWLNGINVPSASRLREISRITGISMDELMSNELTS